MGKTVMLKDVRLSFFNGYKARPFKGGDGEPRFSSVMYVVPGSPNATAIANAIIEVAREEWPEKWEQYLSVIKPDPKRYFYVEGTLRSDEGEPYEGADGFYAVRASQAESKGAPLIIDSGAVKGMNLTVKDGRSYTPADKNGLQFPILTAKDGRPYSGCYANVKVNVWAQDNSYGKALRCALTTVQFLRHGDAFGGGAPATAEGFEDATDGAQADDLA